MTFNQLRTFIEVATAGSVVEAARNLIVSPPAVSAAVGSIERELGVRLVKRAGRGLVITPAGVVFACRYSGRCSVPRGSPRLKPDVGRFRTRHKGGSRILIPRSRTDSGIPKVSLSMSYFPPFVVDS